MGMLEDMDKVSKEYKEGDRNYPELLLGQAGVVGGKVGDAVSTVLDYMVPDALGIGETVAEGVQAVADSTVGQYVFGQKEAFKEAFPRTGRGL